MLTCGVCVISISSTKTLGQKKCCITHPRSRLVDCIFASNPKSLSIHTHTHTHTYIYAQNSHPCAHIHSLPSFFPSRVSLCSSLPSRDYLPLHPADWSATATLPRERLQPCSNQSKASSSTTCTHGSVGTTKGKGSRGGRRRGGEERLGEGTETVGTEKEGGRWESEKTSGTR